MVEPTFSGPQAEAQAEVVPSALEALGQSGDTDVLVLACIALGVLAMAAVINAFAARRSASAAARLAQARSSSMSELLRTVRMAEHIADLGVWQFEPATGEQHWSAGMRAIFGIDHNDAFVEGDAETLLFANSVDLVANVLAHRSETETYELRFDIYDREGDPRSICVQACNLRNESGGVARVIAVVRDVTDEVAHKRDLELSRELALSEAQHARELASTDPLTGLANRRRLMSRLDHMLLQARRADAELSLILFDLDHFKAINDTYGHPLGDEVLRVVARIAASQARDSDLVGRMGGEEFAWIVPGAGEQTAKALAERLCKAIAAESKADGMPGVTASVGCAQLRNGDGSLSLFSRADRALYAAKNAGRNQVRLAA